ncbi:MAG: LPXTG cell wall anchor domain-containing protein [Clostridiales bacterium]|jgi:LPXTG-motif cell wall-anchored protein|nr:LPXTG cell wall anchor domain-containing protein [Clostridiales bacterium]
MKLRNKLLAGFVATVLVLSMTLSTALASTDQLPFDYPEEAGVATDNDVWVKIIGGGTVIGDADIAHATRSVDLTISGNASFELEFIYNSDAGWLPVNMPGESVDGEKVYNFPMNGAGTSWCEAVVNLKNKSEGPLQVTSMAFKDENGEVILFHGLDTSGSGDAPKTGVVSTALFLGLGAAVLGTGAVVLKKKED